ncbi:hypothetical protein ACIGFK_29785 [Streptomyces sp. NPDC085524]|uniref:hypothetical protein n=1 Tax=Streptomyces sp. NPDC085524 TaxID=3365728 RepID=UPI0037D17024
MRIKMIITTVTAVSALLTLTTACGGDGSQAGGIGGIGGDSVAANGEGDGGPHEGTLENPTKNGGVNGNAPKNGTAFQKLPKAGTMAAAARFVNGYTRCDQVSKTPSDGAPTEGPGTAEYDKAHSITEVGHCGRGGRTTIVMIKDPKAFQTAFKAEIDAKNGGGNPDGGIVIGQDFAMGSQDSDAMAALLQPQAGLLMLNCHPQFNPPSGFRKEPALVKGCVLTDYYKD